MQREAFTRKIVGFCGCQVYRVLIFFLIYLNQWLREKGAKAVESSHTLTDVFSWTILLGSLLCLIEHVLVSLFFFPLCFFFLFFFWSLFLNYTRNQNMQRFFFLRRSPLNSAYLEREVLVDLFNCFGGFSQCFLVFLKPIKLIYVWCSFLQPSSLSVHVCFMLHISVVSLVLK